tara:strand:- start:150 stop:431 length:282 start_codon:yes stop_codon:yes gene_type:complete
MKSSYELAMERLKSKDSPNRKELTNEQKVELADLDSKFTAKVAERRIFLEKQIEEALIEGNAEEIQALQTQLKSEIEVIEEDREEAKNKIRNR